MVVDEAGYLQEVNKLIIEGELNSDDWSKLTQMTNLTEVDLSKALIDEIPNRAFQDRWAIDKVVLPTTLKKIGECAFQRAALTSVNIPDNVKTIGIYAFGGAKYMQEVHLPDSLTTLGEGAFEYCKSLRTVKLPTQLKEIPWYTFQNCRSLQSVEFHDGITGIGDYAFQNCDLREVTIPQSTTWIGGNAFNGNTNLSKVTLNEGLIDIGASAFYGTAIDTLNSPSTLRNIYNSAFAGCHKLRHINLNEGLVRIERYALANNITTEIVLPSSLEYCSGSAFDDCDSLVTIETRSVMPPNTDGGCPLTGTDLTKAVLYVPVWSLAEYQLATGWNQFYTFRTSDFMPQYVKVNKDFYFTLRDELDPDYRPDIELTYTDNQITDSQGNTDYQHGNLTISGRSKLAVNDFSMVLSPYYKCFKDGNSNYGYYGYGKITPTSLIVKGEMRAENVVLNLYNMNNRWQFVSFPFDVKVSDIVPVDSATSWVIRSHSGAERAAGNTSAVWQNLTADDVLEAGKGYIMHSYRPNSESASYDGTAYAQFTVRPLTTTVNRQQIFNADDRTVTLEEHLAEFEHNRSWNLIGNPYPSYFDTRFLDFEAPFMVWNSYSQNYQAYSPVDDSYILSPAEAFFVQRPVDQESITFLKDGRQTDRYARTLVDEEPASAPQRIKAALDSHEAAAPRTVFNITLARDGRPADRTRVVINEAATMQYDLSRDAAKFMATDAAVSQIYTLNGATRYAINERPLDNGQALLGLHFGADGTYTIGLGTQPDGQVTLEDRLTGTKQQLNAITGYSFTAKAGDSTDRFVLHFDAVATGINNATTDIVLLEDVNEGDSLTITALSKTDAFMPVTTGGRITADLAFTVEVPITQLGGIRAVYTTTENPTVLAILYDAQGNLLGRYTYPATQIELSRGWNWLGYPLGTSLTLNDALALLEPDTDDCIETLDGGFATYTADGEWAGSLQLMQPGRGYLYKSGSDKSFAYNAVSSVANAQALYGAHRLQAKAAPYELNRHRYPNMMPIVATLSGATLSDGSQVVALSDGECRGIANIEADGMIYLSVYGLGNETINFVAFDATTSEALPISNTTAFTADMLGTTGAPYVLHIDGTATGINGNVTNQSTMPDGIYTVGGQRLDRVSQPGLYIIKTTTLDGRTNVRKQVVK